MRDPWAVKQVGENPAKPAGEQMAEKLLTRLEVERVEEQNSKSSELVRPWPNPDVSGTCAACRQGSTLRTTAGRGLAARTPLREERFRVRPLVQARTQGHTVY